MKVRRAPDRSLVPTLQCGFQRFNARSPRIKAARLMGARARPTPFFDDRTKAPRAVPRVLTLSERTQFF
jgi:hypothetical protein